MKKTVKKIVSLVIAATMVFSSAAAAVIGVSAQVATEYQTGDTVCFGSYPQSMVTDEALIEELNSLTADWISYDYYSGDGQDGSALPDDFMEYTDVSYGYGRYRGVRLSSYRPQMTHMLSDVMGSGSNQSVFELDTVYWFKYEAMEWIVLDPDDGLILSKNIIDSQPYTNYIEYNSETEEYENEHGLFANEYGTSSIMEWLMEFSFDAFTADEFDQIVPSEVEHMAQDGSMYESGMFTEEVFFLSESEVNSTAYGFDPSMRDEDGISYTSGTDYAEIQGADSVSWWLRTAGMTSDEVCVVSRDENTATSIVSSTYVGVRPAVRVSDISALRTYTGYNNGDIITLGSYPQSRVTDEATLEQLNSMNVWWRSYDYYSGTAEMNNASSSNYMMYADAYIGERKFRGVVFSQYRPQFTDGEPLAEKSYQDDNGYVINYEGSEIGDAYWFEYEPLEWVVVDPSEMILMSKDIIDSQPFNNYKYDYPLYISSHGAKFYESFADADMKYRANRYDISTIRDWLNDDFYNTAFNASEKKYVSAAAYDDYFGGHRGGVGYMHNPVVHEYVSLPSLDNLTIDGNYESSSSADNHKMELPHGYSDYALCQGLKVFTEEGQEGRTWWWTRQESSGGEGWVKCVWVEDNIPYPNAHNNTDNTSTGVRPVIKYAPEGDAKKVYTNTYYANGGTFLLNDNAVWKQDVTEGLAVEEIVQPVREGYKFAGWADESYSPVEISATMDSADREYYAIWEDASALQSDDTLRIDVKLYRYDEAAGDWVETDRASTTETLKARVFMETSYYTNSGTVAVFYDGSSGGFNSASNLVVNSDPESFAAKNGMTCTQGRYPQYYNTSVTMADAGLITERYSDDFVSVIIDYSFDTDENRRISGDDWLFEFELKARGNFNESRVEIPESTILDPIMAAAALTDVPVGVEGGTAADNISLAEISVQKETSGGGVISASAVTFDANGGIMPKNSQEIYVRKDDIGAEQSAVDAPAKDGCVFIGWADENGEITEVPAIQPYEDMVLTAQWASEANTVIYYLAKGEEPYKTETYSYGADITYITPTDIPEGMTFAGWADAYGNSLPASMGTDAIEAYAVWEAAEFTVTYNIGEKAEDFSVVYGAQVPVPDMSSYDSIEFIGWLDSDGNTAEIPDAMPANNLEFTAKLRYISKANGFDVSAIYDDDCFSEDVSLSVKEISGASKLGNMYMVEGVQYTQVGLFNIKMVNEKSETVQPKNGKKVTVKLPIPAGFTEYHTYMINHWKSDGTRERFSTDNADEARVENGYIIIQVGEFSEFSIHVKSGVSISKLPSKTVYNYKEELDLSGIELTVTKNDGTTETVTDTSKMTVKGYDSSKIGEQTVTVEYEGESADFTVTVSYAWWQWIIRILLLGFLWY